ncbi:MAG: hypothetical protein ACYSTG_07695 [Planctomycetota bacterium]|jgi:hypothetical protein
MKAKRAFFAILLAFLASSANFVSGAVDTYGIEKVRDKAVLNNEDLQIIDSFADEAIQELLRTEDFASIANVRMLILEHMNSKKQSAQAQYTDQLFNSAHKYIEQALGEVSELSPGDRKFKLMVNLLILIDSLENLKLADLALGAMKDENAIIRYWAVHSVTNPGFTKKLNSGKAANLQLARRIAEQLKVLVAGSSPETIGLMAEFAADVNIAEGEDLLLQIADVRMKKYAYWTVDYELLDGAILKSLHTRISLPGRSKPAVAMSFGQLYSYVIQRYAKGQKSLSATQKRQLASVIVEIEKICVSRLLEMPQSAVQGIKRAMENKDYVGLLREHNKLLGGETRPGLLPSRLKFSYLNPDGTKRTAPFVLPNAPRVKPSE